MRVDHVIYATDDLDRAAAAIESELGGDELPVRVVPGSDGVRAVGIGARELRSR